MISLKNEKNESHKKQKVGDICKKWFSTDDDNKKYHKVRDHCHHTGKYRGAANNICNLRHKAPEKIPVIFHYDSTYAYHFIIKDIAKEFDGQFEYLGENTKNIYNFFSSY